jgi:hypothetical protein
MCFGRSSSPPPAPTTPAPAPQAATTSARNMEDMSPTIEIEDQDEAKTIKKNKVGTKKLQTSINSAPVASAGLEIPN